MIKLRTLALALALFGLLAAACSDDASTEAESTGTEDAGTEAESTDAGGADAEAGDDEASDDEMTDDEMTDDEAGETADSGDFPVTIESDGGSWTLEAAPQRIVSLSPTATEILFAIGAGDQVVAVDAFSNYPADTPITDLSGFDPNVEAVIGYEPDLVVVAGDANDIVASLTELDIPVLVNPAPADIESGYAGMAELGVATGHVDETADVIATMRADIDAALAAAPEVPIRIYHELDETYFSASSFGFVGAVYAELGTENIADDADADQSGFPQLTEEYIVTADPELIVITDQVTYSPADVAARPGWDAISAVTNDGVLVVEADTASRWGPRLPLFINEVADALATVAVPAS